MEEIFYAVAGAACGYLGAIVSHLWLSSLSEKEKEGYAWELEERAPYRFAFAVAGAGGGALACGLPGAPLVAILLIIILAMVHSDLMVYLVSDGLCLLLGITALIYGTRILGLSWTFMGIGALTTLLPAGITWFWFRNKSLITEDDELPFMGLGDVKAFAATSPLLGECALVPVLLACFIGALALLGWKKAVRREDVGIPFLVFYLPCWWITLTSLHR